MTEKREFGEKYIFMKSHFAEEERLRKRRENAGQIHIYEVSLRREERLRERKDKDEEKE